MAKGKWCTTTISTCCPRKPPIFCLPSVLFPVSGMLQNRCFLSLVCLASSLNSSYPRPMPRPFYTICNTQIQLFFLFLQIAQFEKELSVFQWQNHNDPDQEKIPFVHCCMFVNSRGSLWSCSSVATSGNGIVLGGPCGCQN